MQNIVIKILSVELIEKYPNTSYIITDKSNINLKEDNVIYNNDGTFKAIKISDNIFANVLDKDLNKKATKKLKEQIGKCYIITESGYKINIDKIFIKEFLFSKSRQSLNKNKFIIKLILINYIEDIINN